MADLSKEEMAKKAQKLAEENFSRGNVFGAQQWMLSAVKLAPGLPGNAHAVAAYDVHVAARKPPPDCWYAVLGLPDPRLSAVTHDDVKRQHRKLCLMVHPDKNASPAADGAFKLVQAAWDALSARHPPEATAAAAAAPTRPTWPRAPPPPRPTGPPPPPPPRPQPAPRPKVVQMPRKPAASSPATSYPQPPPAPRVVPKTGDYSQKAQRAPPKQQKARRRMAPPPAMPTSPPTTTGMCPNCGASTSSYGKSNFRCMSCQWSPMDGRHDEDYDDEEYYE